MTTRTSSRRAAPAAADLDADLDRIASMNIDSLRALWRKEHGREPPAALSKDLLARALAYRAQEKQFGGLDAACRKLLGSIGREGSASTRWLKIGTVIVRSHAGVTHEVVVTPEGFCWRGQTYTSLSTIALRITGTSWNGARFFGLTGDVKPAVQTSPTSQTSSSTSGLAPVSGDGQKTVMAATSRRKQSRSKVRA